MGFALLGAATCFFVISLQKEAVEEASAEQGRREEQHMVAIVRGLAERELGPEGGNLQSFASRLLSLVAAHPDYLDVVVLDRRGKVVRHFSRRGGGVVPCVAHVPEAGDLDLEHDRGRLADHPVGCRSIRVVAAGEDRGAVLFHVERNWGVHGDGVARLVRATALRIAPVFVASYVLLGVLLIVASRAVRKWRARAASFERVQALGALADGINHEIRNPLNALGLSLQYLARKHDDTETREVVATASREAEKIHDRLEEFVRFTRVSRLDTQRIALGERLATR